MAARRESAVLKDILWFRCEVVFEGRVGSWCELELGRKKKRHIESQPSRVIINSGKYPFLHHYIK